MPATDPKPWQFSSERASEVTKRRWANTPPAPERIEEAVNRVVRARPVLSDEQRKRLLDILVDRDAA